MLRRRVNEGCAKSYKSCVYSRYEYADLEFETVLGFVRDFFARRFVASPLNTYPWLRYLGFISNMVTA